MKLHDSDRLSLGTLLRRFWRPISLTWALTLIETAALAAMPLFIGWSIDGLLHDDWSAFQLLIVLFASVLLVATVRRIYDTRAYGTIRVELGETQASRSSDSVSIVNAQILMGRELVDFLEVEAPIAATSLVQVAVAIAILFLFDPVLAATCGGSAVAILIIYGSFSTWFFNLNRALNEQTENQIEALESLNPKKIALHFLGLRKQEVKLSDAESVVYGLIFFVLLSMLAFNLWFAATKTSGTPGEIFSIVTYSLEFLQSAVALPATLQILTRLKEITERLNQLDSA